MCKASSFTFHNSEISVKGLSALILFNPLILKSINTWAGTINTIQGIVLRKHPMTELSAAQKEPDLKRQRTCTKLVMFTTSGCFYKYVNEYINYD
jgi:hypothetical protein